MPSPAASNNAATAVSYSVASGFPLSACCMTKPWTSERNSGVSSGRRHRQRPAGGRHPSLQHAGDLRPQSAEDLLRHRYQRRIAGCLAPHRQQEREQVGRRLFASEHGLPNEERGDVGGAGWRLVLGELGQPALDAAEDLGRHCHDDLVLGPEVQVDRTGGQVRLADHVRHRCAVEAVAGETLPGGEQDLLATGLAVGVGDLGHRHILNRIFVLDERSGRVHALQNERSFLERKTT